MSEQTVTFNAKSIGIRLIPFVVLIVVILFGWHAVRLQLGSMLSELTVSTDEGAEDIARIAQDLGPSDPSAKWLAASLEKDKFEPGSVENSLKLFEDTIRLSAYDFRWWLELARAYEQAGKPQQADVAFKRAIELAPHYTYPHWQAGNFYLRQGRSEEAFSEFKKTTENNLPYREQVFSLAWEYFDKDASKVEQFAGDSPDTRAYLALFFALKRAPMDSLRVWNTLSEEQKAENVVVSKTITQSLYERRLFRAAVAFSDQVGLDSGAKAETVSNGSFEKPITVKGDSYFGWNMTPEVEKVKAELDPNQKKEGARSVRVTFNGFSKDALFTTWQTVALEPKTNYRLTFWVKTENLRSGGPPSINVLNGSDNKVVAVSKSFPTGTADWQEMTLDFASPVNADGVIVSLGRTYCGDPCPIVGTLWLDDIKINKL